MWLIVEVQKSTQLKFKNHWFLSLQLSILIFNKVYAIENKLYIYTYTIHISATPVINIFRLFDASPNFAFSTSETYREY